MKTWFVRTAKHLGKVVLADTASTDAAKGECLLRVLDGLPLAYLYRGEKLVLRPICASEQQRNELME